MFAQNQARFLPISGAAMASTFGLFYLMQGLVASDTVTLIESRTRPDFNIVISDPEPPEVREIERVLPPPPIEPEPNKLVHERKLVDEIFPTRIPGPIPKIQPQRGPDLSPTMIDGDRIPLVRVTPNYPHRALQNAVEGWALVEFTVNRHGEVVDPSIIDAEPKGFFEKATLKAIQKFKYKPTVVDGQPRATPGVRFRMVFDLADD